MPFINNSWTERLRDQFKLFRIFFYCYLDSICWYCSIKLLAIIFLFCLFPELKGKGDKINFITFYWYEQNRRDTLFLEFQSMSFLLDSIIGFCNDFRWPFKFPFSLLGFEAISKAVWLNYFHSLMKQFIKIFLIFHKSFCKLRIACSCLLKSDELSTYKCEWNFLQYLRF